MRYETFAASGREQGTTPKDFGVDWTEGWEAVTS